jgi:hypothetical protein
LADATNKDREVARKYLAALAAPPTTTPDSDEPPF